MYQAAHKVRRTQHTDASFAIDTHLGVPIRCDCTTAILGLLLMQFVSERWSGEAPTILHTYVRTYTPSLFLIDPSVVRFAHVALAPFAGCLFLVLSHQTSNRGSSDPWSYRRVPPLRASPGTTPTLLRRLPITRKEFSRLFPPHKQRLYFLAARLG